MDTISYKSHIRYYWISWIILFPTLLLLKFLHAPILEKVPIYAVYFIYFLIIGCVSWFESQRFSNYLVDHQLKKHEEVSGKWPATFEGLRFIYSSDDFNDDNVRFLKLNYKKFLIFIIVVFIGFPVFAILETFI